MSGAFLDSNVILDIVTGNPDWAEWSSSQTVLAGARGPVWVNSIVYAELCYGFNRIEETDDALHRVGAVLIDTPRSALFDAAKAYMEYRRRGGPKTSILPDFFIGAHALALGARLITRDPKGFRAAFPGLEIEAP